MTYPPSDSLPAHGSDRDPSGLPPAPDEQAGSPLPPSPTRRRATRGVAVLIASVALLAALVILAMSAGEDERARSTASPSEEVLLRDDFSDPASGWGEHRTNRMTARYVDGVYRFSLSRPMDDAEWFLSGSPVQGVSVEADVLPVGGMAGVACSASEASGQYYAFIVRAGTDYYAILKVSKSNGGHAIAEGHNTAISGSATDHIRADCVAGTPGEPTDLTMWVNGSELAHVEDATGFASFDAMGVIVLSLRTGHIHADFDNAVARRVS